MNDSTIIDEPKTKSTTAIEKPFNPDAPTLTEKARELFEDIPVEEFRKFHSTEGVSIDEAIDLRSAQVAEE